MENKTIHGIITRGVGGLYGVRTSEHPDDELLCRAHGVFRKEQITPTVGDDVVISHVSGADDGAIPDEVAREIRKQKKNGVEVDYVIDAIDTRKNVLIRPPVANLDYLFAVIPCASPEPDLLTADKLTVIAENAGIETVVVINKTDLNPEKSMPLFMKLRAIKCSGSAAKPVKVWMLCGIISEKFRRWKTADTSAEHLPGCPVPENPR